MGNYRERNHGNKKPKLFEDDIRKTIGCFLSAVYKNNLKTEFK